MPRIELHTFTRSDRETIFNLSRSVDLHIISTADTNERAIAGVTSGLMELGDSVTWEATHFGVRQRLTSRITELVFPERFVDEMVSGAFRHFKHEHIFTVKDEGTLMTDVFEYSSPWGVLGKLADVMFLKSYMTNLLEKRNNTLREYAESGRHNELLG